MKERVVIFIPDCWNHPDLQFDACYQVWHPYAFAFVAPASLGRTAHMFYCERWVLKCALHMPCACK